MKKLAVLVLAVLLLGGCTGKRSEMDTAMQLRAALLACRSCSFDADITADYGDKVHTFSMTCTADSKGAVSFTVTAPESIAGITGAVSDEDGHLTFDDAVLAFPLLADGQVTPVSGPWILIKTLRGGYLTACAAEGELLRLTIDDSYEDDALQMDIWLNGDSHPVQAEILYDGRRIVTMEIKNFEIV